MSSAARPSRKDPLRSDNVPHTPKGQRRDPRRPRHINATAPWAEVINKDPGRHYVFASLTDPFTGLGFYEAIGYRVETQQAGENALRMRGGRTARVGENITMLGCALLSIANEDWEALEQDGYDGNGGQTYADQVEEVIIKDTGKRDLFRGLGADSYLHLKSKIQAPTEEAMEA